MPHHSKQGAAAGGAYGASGSSANDSPNGSHLSTQKSFPPTDYSAASQQSTPSRRNSFPSSTSMPNRQTSAGTEFQKQQQHQQSLFHRVPASPPESLPKHNKEGQTEKISGSSPPPPSPPATLKQSHLPSDHDPTNNNNRDDHDDHGDPKNDRIVAANVLLLAAAASKERNRIQLEQQQQEMDDDNASHGADTIATSGSTSNGPLKKRKTVVDILRQKPAAEDHHNQHHHPADPYHVSPMSHGSKSTATLMANESTTPNSANDLGNTSRALSYESKEEATSSANSSKNGTPIHNTSSILKKSSAAVNSGNSNHSSPKSATQFPPSNNTIGGSSNTNASLVPYFPSALHWLLTESSSQTASPEYAAARSVLQWVPHGQAWRVVRWDALRKQVLPQFFPQLTGSVDGFLWHLAAWGFEEIQDGPDVGAFGHTLFRRGHPQLCQEMKFTPEILEGANKHGPSDDSRSILRVPSLATAGSGETPSSGPDSQDKDPGRNSASSSYTGTPPTNARHRSPFGHRGGGWATSPSSVRANLGPPIYVNYRPDDVAEAWAHQQYSNYPGKQGPPTPGPWMHSHAAPTPPHGVGGNGAALRPPQGMPPYSPIRIRSGRGARRMSNNRGIRHAPSAESISTVSTVAASSTRSFPVSNRGKGRRNIAATLPNNSKSRSNTPEASEGLTMLAKMGEQHQQQQQQPQQLKPQETGTTNEESERRNVLKRKLPLSSSSASSTTKVDAASTGD